MVQTDMIMTHSKYMCRLLISAVWMCLKKGEKFRLRIVELRSEQVVYLRKINDTIFVSIEYVNIQYSVH